MVIKSIEDTDILDLMELHYRFHQCLATKLNRQNSVRDLMSELDKEDVRVLGLFKDTKLVGFTLGYKYAGELFYFSKMYIEPKYRLYMKDLWLKAEDDIRDKYTGWISHSSTPKGINMHSKMGATPIEIKYYKEL